MKGHGEKMNFTKRTMLIQERFKMHKLKGGWYKPDKEIFDEIEKLKAKYPHVVGD
jgi:hypothetical protein